MNLIFANNQTVDLEIDNNPLGLVYQQIYKNLCHVSIPWRPWDNPFYEKNFSYQEMVEHLITYANKLSICVDKSRCLDQDQGYFNLLHSYYEKNYNGDPIWLDFHEHLHLCEMYFNNYERYFCIDYREKSGPLERAIEPVWISNPQTTIATGTLFVNWSELGKNPYSYWKDGEPDNIERMCELAKPWLKLRPKIYIALNDIDTTKNLERDEFESWWKTYHDEWVRHWKLSSWGIENIFGVGVIGKTNQVDTLIQLLENNVRPVRVTLQ